MEVARRVLAEFSALEGDHGRIDDPNPGQLATVARRAAADCEDR